MSEHKKLMSKDLGPVGLVAIHEIRTMILDMQLVLGIRDLDMVAIVGQAIGEVFACGDVSFEKREGDTLPEECKEPFKQVLILNFHDGYNKHRAMHERGEHACAVKPEPKIV